MQSSRTTKLQSFENSFPELFQLIQKEYSARDLTLCIGGKGDEVLTLQKNQMITSPPYTM